MFKYHTSFKMPPMVLIIEPKTQDTNKKFRIYFHYRNTNLHYLHLTFFKKQLKWTVT